MSCEGEDWYGLECSSSVMRSGHHMTSDAALHTFTIELPCSHHRFYLNRFVCRTVQTDTEAGDCGEMKGRNE